MAVYFYDEEVKSNNQFAVTIYWRKSERHLHITSIQSVKFIPSYTLIRLINTLPYTLPDKLEESIERERWYYVDLLLNVLYDEDDYRVVEFTDVTEHPNEFYRVR